MKDSEIKMEDLIEIIRKDSRWEGKDKFPSPKEYSDEVSKWLQFIDKQGQFKSFEPRLKDMPEKRDEALAEIQSAYYLVERKGYEIIKWHPKIGEKSCEYIIRINEKEIYCEVKTPNWKDQIVIEEGRQSERTKKSKILPIAEFRFNDNSFNIRKAIRKAYEQLPKNEPSLLIIIGNKQFISNREDDYFGVRKALYGHKNISTDDISYLWLKSFGINQERYWQILIENYYICDITDGKGRLLPKFTGHRHDFIIPNIPKVDEERLFSILEMVNPNRYFNDDSYSGLSALACLDILKYLGKNEMQYCWEIFENPHAINIIPKI